MRWGFWERDQRDASFSQMPLVLQSTRAVAVVSMGQEEPFEFADSQNHGKILKNKCDFLMLNL